ncbi:MAG: replicative DNA helicase [Selenomonadaceae bacterium]|nr:replicative DNA helicase [Selenomonadaceae bacterium]
MIEELNIPEAIEVEKKLLSALMIKGGEAIPEIATLLTAEDFYRQEHKLIYKAMLRLSNNGIPLDVLIVEQTLRKSGDLDKVTRQYLFGLLPLEYTTLRAETYAKVIRQKSLMRQIMTAGKKLAVAASDERNRIEDVLGYAEKEILSIANRQVQTGFEDVGEILQRSFERIHYMHAHRGETLGVESGLTDLDRILNGFQKSDLILLAARPSMGKTALALNIAMNASKEKVENVVAMFSLEMSKVQLGNRLLSTASGVNSQQLNTGNFGDDDMNKLISGLEQLSKCKLYIDDTASIGLMELRSKARRIKYERGLDMIIIDYLQLMQGGKAENRQQEISEISRTLKAMARELDVPIIALSQLSRSVELRAEKKPQLSDLRESGSLEQDADIVMFLYRDEYYNREDAENKNIAELIIAKNRNGPTTSLHLYFNKETMKFDDLTRADN